MKKTMTILAVLFYAIAFGQQWKVSDSKITQNISVVAFEGANVIAFSENGAITYSSDTGKTWTKSGFNTGAQWVSASIHNGKVYATANAYVKATNSIRPCVYKLTLKGDSIKRTAFSDGFIMYSGIVAENKVVLGIAKPTSTFMLLQFVDTNLTGGGTYANLGFACGTGAVKIPTKLVIDSIGKIQGIGVGALSKNYNGVNQYSFSIANIQEVNGGKLNYILTSDGKILNRNYNADKCEAFSVKLTTPNDGLTSFNSFCTNGTKYMVGGTGKLIYFTGQVWSTTNTPGITWNKLILINGKVIAFGSNGKIQNTNL